jgi:sulfate transport system ATP-binding protein/putative spermidine/putrescine transport system ATP-binding protein
MSLVQNLNSTMKDFKIEIPKWEILDQGVTALWGASGSGKSTVLRCLLGLEKTDSVFQWQVNGKNLAELTPPERRIGMVFQSFELFPHLSAEENIWYSARVRKVQTESAMKLYQQLSTQLELERFSKRKPHQLSGGEKQRVALARALMGFPQILFLDEPFSALDENLRGQARNLVANVLKSSGIPAVLVTHDENDLKALATKVTQISLGRISAED